MRSALAVLALLSGCVSYERAEVHVGDFRCLEPVPPVVVGHEIVFSANGSAGGATLSPEAHARLESSPQIVRLYSLGQALLFLQSALFQLCLGAANGTIEPKDHAALVRLVIREAGQLLWLEGNGPWETPADEAPILQPEQSR